MKPNLSVLPPDVHDVLRHEGYNDFWNDVETYFDPISASDLTNLRQLSAIPHGGAKDPMLRLPDPINETVQITQWASFGRQVHALTPIPGSVSGSTSQAHRVHQSSDASIPTSGRVSSTSGTLLPTVQSSTSSRTLPTSSTASAIDLCRMPNDHTVLNSFPFTQRLVAALIDEGGGGMPSSTPYKPARGAAAAAAAASAAAKGDIEQFWPGMGNATDLRSYQTNLETRVISELQTVGLLPTNTTPQDDLTIALRHYQWQLRDLKTSNRIYKTNLITRGLTPELKTQAMRREQKRYANDIQIMYIDRMSKRCKKNKKTKNKYPKLKLRLFRNYKPKTENKDLHLNGTGDGGAFGRPSSSIDTPSRIEDGVSIDNGPIPRSTPSSSSKHGRNHATFGSGPQKLSAPALQVGDGAASRSSKSSKKKKRKSDTNASRPTAAAKSGAAKGKAQ